MKRLVTSIDPGVRKLGIAVFADGLLYASALIKADGTDTGVTAWQRIADKARTWRLDHHPPGYFPKDEALVSEYPQVYDAAHQKGGHVGQNDLIELTGVVGYLLGVIEGPGEKVTYLPRVWKGTMDKEAMQERILSRLSADERKNAVEQSDVIDAVGVGLFYLGRLQPKKVYAHE